VTSNAEKAAEELRRINNGRAMLDWDSWLDRTVKMACALYELDPSEISFDFGTQEEK
jgi:hypothetical protein